MRIALALLAAVLLGSCAGNAGDAVSGEYAIGYGQKREIGGGLSLEFTSVGEESRCPVNVECFWEGNAKIFMTWRSPRGTGSFELNSHSSFPTSAAFDFYTVELRNLEPYPGTAPQSGSPSAPYAGYVATVFVDRAVTR